MRADLHTHTQASDGSLSVQELLKTAIANQVDLISITDHDTVAAYQQLLDPQAYATAVVPGSELSTSWQGVGVHVLALNIDLSSAALMEAIAFQSQARITRAHRIAEKLDKRLKLDLLPAALAHAGTSAIGRPHFAKAMIDAGIVTNWRDAFSKYLGRGKVGDVKTGWAPLSQIIDWIRAAGGTAVIAHPLHYRLTNAKLNRLVDDFIALGGQAIEVISSSQNIQSTNYLARLCQDKGLLASCGSDFHHLSDWSQPGRLAPLPNSCRPVWDSWS